MGRLAINLLRSDILVYPIVCVLVCADSMLWPPAADFPVYHQLRTETPPRPVNIHPGQSPAFSEGVSWQPERS